MFICDLCGKTFTKKQWLIYHIESHLGIKLFSCTICEETFIRPGHLARHERIHSGDSPAFRCNSVDTTTCRCDLCNFSVSSKRGLILHIKEHLGYSGEHEITCGICQLRLSSVMEMKKHVRLHSNVNKYYCKICDTRFQTVIECLKHRAVHTQERKQEREECFGLDFVKCSKCNNEYFSNAQLDIHRCSTDKTEMRICGVCNRQFDGLYRLRFHLNVHTGEKPFICFSCNAGFYNPSDLKSHKQLHSDTKNFVCEHCGKRFQQYRGLTWHKTRTHKEGSKLERGFSKCKVCNACVQGLSAHMRIHTGERPFFCPICGNSFTQASTQKNHMVTHSNKRYKCKDCHKKFKHPMSLKFHTRKHTKQNLRKCDVCSMEFITGDILKRHMESHSQIRKPCPICGKDLANLSLPNHLKTHKK